MSITPKRESVVLARRSPPRASATSAVTASTSPPCCRHAAATAWRSSGPRAHNARLAPSRAAASASARPRPRDAPVIRILAPLNRGIGAIDGPYAHPDAGMRRKASALGRIVGSAFRRTFSVDQAAPDGENRSLGAVINPEFAQDSTHMRLHCLFPDSQPAGDLFVREAFHYQREH